MTAESDVRAGLYDPYVSTAQAGPASADIAAQFKSGVVYLDWLIGRFVPPNAECAILDLGAGTARWCIGCTRRVMRAPSEWSFPPNRSRSPVRLASTASFMAISSRLARIAPTRARTSFSWAAAWSAAQADAGRLAPDPAPAAVGWPMRDSRAQWAVSAPDRYGRRAPRPSMALTRWRNSGSSVPHCPMATRASVALPAAQARVR